MEGGLPGSSIPVLRPSSGMRQREGDGGDRECCKPLTLLSVLQRNFLQQKFPRKAKIQPGNSLTDAQLQIRSEPREGWVATDGPVSMARPSQEWARVPRAGGTCGRSSSAAGQDGAGLGRAGVPGCSQGTRRQRPCHVPGPAPALVTRTPLCPALCFHRGKGILWDNWNLSPARAGGGGRAGANPVTSARGGLTLLGWEDSRAGAHIYPGIPLMSRDSVRLNSPCATVFHRGGRGDALPGCAGQGQVRGTAEASCLFPVLFPAALPLHSGSRELGEGLLPSPGQALPQTNACPGAFSICETGQAVDSIFFFFFS